MKPFTAPISDRSRELYGTYMRRYADIPSMRPFNIDISDHRRELFGEYMRRYETVPSMKPFDASLGDRSRNLYGEYRSRWSTQKVGQYGTDITDANGVAWVDCDFTFSPLVPKFNDIAIYQLQFIESGGWAGNLLYRVVVNGVKVYPFENDATATGAWEYLGTLSTTVRVGDVCVVQIRSDNAGDVGPGQASLSAIRYAIFEPYVG